MFLRACYAHSASLEWRLELWLVGLSRELTAVCRRSVFVGISGFFSVAVRGFTASFEDALSGAGGDGVLDETFSRGCLSGRVRLRSGITLVTAFLLSQELKQHLSRCSGLEFNDIFVVRIWGVMSP